MSRFSKKYVPVALLCAIGVLLGMSAALASKDDPPLYTTIGNEYIRYNIGYGGTIDFKVGDTSYSYPVNGGFSAQTVVGDPTTSLDDNKNMMPRLTDADTFITSPYQRGAHYRLRIGSTNYMFGQSGTWTEYPTLFVPPSGIGYGKTGAFIEGKWTSSDATIAVTMNVGLVRDTIRQEFTFQNVSTTTQKVGFAMVGEPPYVPDVFLPGIGQLTYGKWFGPTAIPDVLELFDNLTTPALVARNTFTGQDASKPDYMAVGESSTFVSTGDGDFPDATLQLWLEPTTGNPTGGFTADPRIRFTLPGWMIVWKQRNVAAGASFKIVTYYGCGAANTAWTVKNASVVTQDSAALAVQGPRTLKYDTTDITSTTGLAPNQFTIKPYVYNLATDIGAFDLHDVTATIYLPKGLEMVSLPGNTATQEIGYVPSNTEMSGSGWTVRATGEVLGDIEYFVSAYDSVTGWNRSVSRKVLVPATTSTTIKSGWQLQSVPFSFDNSNIYNVFGKSPGQIFAQYWDPTGAGKYRSLTNVVTGQGFWLFGSKTGAGSVSIASDASLVGLSDGKQTQPVIIPVSAGWNLVANPFLYPVYWGQLLVYNKTENLVLPLDKAVAKNWLSLTLYSYNADKGAYEYLRTLSSQLMPYKSYWLRSRFSLQLIITPSVYPGSDVTVPIGG